MNKEKLIWDMVSKILQTHGDEVDNISIHEDDTTPGEERRKIYCSLGYCFELTRMQAEEGEVEEVIDGFVYCFCEPWDGFNEAGIDKAIEILNLYAGLEINS